MKGELAKCIDPVSKQIQVNWFGQVCEDHPILIDSMSQGKRFHNIFSFGDVCRTPANEPKNIVSMYQYADQIAYNVYQTCHPGSPSLKRIPSEFTVVQAIPIGSKGGLLAINNMIKYDPTTPAEKNKIQE